MRLGPNLDRPCFERYGKCASCMVARHVNSPAPGTYRNARRHGVIPACALPSLRFNVHARENTGEGLFEASIASRKKIIPALPLHCPSSFKHSRSTLFSPLCTRKQCQSLTAAEICHGMKQTRTRSAGEPHRRQTSRTNLTILGTANGQKERAHDVANCASRMSCRPRYSRHILRPSIIWVKRPTENAESTQN